MTNGRVINFKWTVARGREREEEMCMWERWKPQNTIGSMNSAYKYHQLKITVPKYYVLESTVYLNNSVNETFIFTLRWKILSFKLMLDATPTKVLMRKFLSY